MDYATLNDGKNPQIKDHLILLMCNIIENLFCASLFRRIIDYIAKPAQQANIIRLLTRVVSIESRDDTIRVTTNAGTVLDFDEVVVCCRFQICSLHLQAILFY